MDKDDRYWITRDDRYWIAVWAVVALAVLLLIAGIVAVNLPDWALERRLIAECQRVGGERRSEPGTPTWKGACYRVTRTPIATDSTTR